MSSKKIVLISIDRQSFEIDEKIARKMLTISHMIDDDCADAPIRLPNAFCTGDILAKVIEYCKNTCDQDNKGSVDSTEAEIHDDHVEKGKGKEVAEDIDNVEKGKGKEGIWDATEFMKNLDFETICKVMMATNYLNFKSLLDLSLQAIADNIKDLEPEEIRKVFNIENDFTKEEEDEVRKENLWAYEK